MPNYDYECKKCGKMTIWHPEKEERKDCPLCGDPVEKLEKEKKREG